MTTVIMRERDVGVTIAFDSQMTIGCEKAEMENSKVFRNGNVIFGVAGLAKNTNVLRFMDVPERTTWDTDEYVTKQLVPAINEVVKNSGGGSSSTGSLNGSLLAVVNGRVYDIESNLGWVRRTDKTYAIGSGSGFALGAIFAGATEAEALDIASQHDSYTGGTLTVIQSTELLEGIGK